MIHSIKKHMTVLLDARSAERGFFMKKTRPKKCFVRVCSALFIILFIVMSLPGNVLAAGTKTSTISKKQKVYDIAVVYDNSLSMYHTFKGNTPVGPNKAWSRAKYAMEIFASMLDYEAGDRLTIFPMAKVVTDGSKPLADSPEDDDKIQPIKIEDPKDIDKISKMWTIHPKDTPLAPIDEATAYLKKSNKSERWLIVLTDGAFDHDARDKEIGKEESEPLLIKKLNAAAGAGCHVQYLAMGNDATALASTDAFYADKASDTEVKAKLVTICNKIFDRIELPSKYLNGNKLQLPLSMRKLIVFVQGKDAKIQSLKSADGKTIPAPQNSGQRKTNDYNAGSKWGSKGEVDNTLAGQVVTFDACAKGDYTLDVSDADEIQVFYDPDIDIDIKLKNSFGEEIDSSETDLVAGDYTIEYGLVDNVTKENVDGNELLGDVDLIAEMLDSEDAEHGTPLKSGQTITLEPDEGEDEKSIYFVVEGTYLKEYTITSRGTDTIPFPIRIILPELNAISVKATVGQEKEWYVISKHEKWNPIRVDVRYSGEKLTSDEMSKLAIEYSFEDTLTYHTEILPEESAINVFICTDEAGTFTKPETGKYKMAVKGSVTDEYGRTIDATDSVEFQIASVEQWQIILGVSLVLLLLLLLVAMILRQKVLPKKIVLETSSFMLDFEGEELDGVKPDVKYNRKAGSLTIKTPSHVPFDQKADVSLKLRPVDRRITKSKDRRIGIVGISSSSCWLVSINNVPYVKNDQGKWVKQGTPAGATPKPIDQEAKNAMFVLRGGTDEAPVSTLNAKIKHK